MPRRGIENYDMDSESENVPLDDPHLHDAADAALAVSMLLAGKVIVYPTETFYGFLASLRFPDAVLETQTLKGRKTAAPLPCIIGDENDLSHLADNVTPLQKKLMALFWPGPLTLVFDARDDLPATVTGHTKTVGVRVPGHSGARRIAIQTGPLTATSANLSGEPPAHHVTPIADRFSGIPIFDGGTLAPSFGSTVLDVRSGNLEIIRAGDLSIKTIERTLKKGVR